MSWIQVNGSSFSWALLSRAVVNALLAASPKVCPEEPSDNLISEMKIERTSLKTA